MGGMKGRSGGARRNAGRPRKTPLERWLTGTGPRPVTAGTSAVQELEEPASEPGELPPHWRPETRAWHAAIVAEWELGDAGLALLRHAGECLNLEQECRDAIVQDGLMVPYGAHRKAHPLLQTAATARGQFLTLMCQLGFTR